MNLDMTLRDFFAMAERVGAAAQTIRETQALLTGQPVPPMPALMVSPAAYAEMLDPAPRRAHRPTVSNKPVEWSAQELAQREKMRVERETALLREMPDDVKAAVGS